MSGLPVPSTREEQWRSARIHGVAWIDSEISEGVDDLPAALKYGNVILTDGPRYGFGDCRAIFIIGQPPMNDVHGSSTYIRTRTTIRVPDHIDGEHVWRLRTLGCAPWRVVDPSLYETPTPYASQELERLHGFAQEFWGGPDYTCAVKDGSMTRAPRHSARRAVGRRASPRCASSGISPPPASPTWTRRWRITRCGRGVRVNADHQRYVLL